MHYLYSLPSVCLDVKLAHTIGTNTFAVAGGGGQVLGSVPPCNTSSPECIDPHTGSRVCCTAPCEVLGTGIPQWAPVDQRDVGGGGIVITHAGMDIAYVDPAVGLASGGTLRCRRQLRELDWPVTIDALLRVRHSLTLPPPPNRMSDKYKCPFNPHTGVMEQRSVNYVVSCDNSLPIGRRT